MQHELLVDSGGSSRAQTLKEVPDGPAIVIGNEFLDTLPVRQFVRVNSQWRERTVQVNGDGALAFTVADKQEPYIRASAANGEVLEVNPSAHRIMFELGLAARKTGRRCAHDRLRPCRHRFGERCKRCAHTAISTRWPRRASATSQPTSISPPWRAARAQPARPSSAD